MSRNVAFSSQREEPGCMQALAYLIPCCIYATSAQAEPCLVGVYYRGPVTDAVTCYPFQVLEVP